MLQECRKFPLKSLAQRRDQELLIESGWPILPVLRRKKPCLKCVWAIGSSSPYSLPGYEVDNESLYLLPQKTQILTNMMNQMSRESWNPGWPSKSTCVVIKGRSKVQLVGKFLLQLSIPIRDLPASRNTIVPVSYCRTHDAVWQEEKSSSSHSNKQMLLGKHHIPFPLDYSHSLKGRGKAQTQVARVEEKSSSVKGKHT